MSNDLLKGKRGIISGALDSNSIAWKVAEKANQQGAKFVLTNAPIAMRMGEIKKLAEQTKSEIIAADATNGMDGRQVHDIEAHGGDIRQTPLGSLQRGRLALATPLGARKELVPGAHGRGFAIHHQWQFTVVPRRR